MNINENDIRSVHSRSVILPCVSRTVVIYLYYRSRYNVFIRKSPAFFIFNQLAFCVIFAIFIIKVTCPVQKVLSVVMSQIGCRATVGVQCTSYLSICDVTLVTKLFEWGIILASINV